MATEVLVAIRRDPDKAFEKQAVRLRDELQKHFSVVCPRADVLQETGDVPERFPLHVRELESKLRDMVVADILPALYRHWQIEFGKLPSVQVFEADSDPAAAWKRMGMDDSAMANWTGAQFPTFVDRLLFGVNDPDARHDLNSGTAYWSMMREKIGLVAQQAVHSLRVRLLTRARSIQSELSQLAHRNGEVESEHGQGSRAGIDEDLARIKELAQ